MTLPDPAPERPSPGPAALFLGFSKIALTGFGGVLPFAYRAIVEQRKWLTPDEFTAMLSSAQVLPGPIICNVTLMIGARFAGTRGALAALAGMIGGPFLFVLALGVLYERFGELQIFRSALTGMAAVAAGLIASTAAKMALPMLTAGSDRSWLALLTVLAFVGAALLKMPMIEIMAFLGPVGIAVAYWRNR